MQARQQPTSRLAFCCAAAQLDNEKDTDRRRVALFELAERYLGLRDMVHTDKVESQMQEKARELLSELAMRDVSACATMPTDPPPHEHADQQGPATGVHLFCSK